MRFISPLLALGCLAAAAPAPAQQNAARPDNEAAPLRQVVLFTSGVGYFERTGRINGPAEASVTFRTEEVNDALKSMVVLDPSGRAQMVTYGGMEPLSSRVRVAGLAQNGNVTVAELLRSFRGAQLELETEKHGTVTGRLISVSTRFTSGARPDFPPVTVDVLNIMEEGRLRSFGMTEVQHVRLLDARLDRELRESLEMLAGGLDDRTRTLTVKFGDGGARDVAIGYLRETPVWKTSYRLVLERDKKPYLQAWSIVENMTDEDWKEVRLSLVSGRPISFIQNLFEPLYVARPEVALQVTGSPRPQLYAEAVQQDKSRGRAAGAAGPAGPPGGFGGGGMMGGAMGGRPESMARAPKADGSVNVRFRATNVLAEMEAQQSMAAGQERGELFAYSIKEPVTIARGRSAMVPIVSAEVSGEAVSIYDPEVDRTKALNGFLLKNSTGLHLAGGPITVFADSVYAGDAQITQMQPNDDRLISYAVDGEIVPEVKPGSGHSEISTLVIVSGVLQVTRKLQQETIYGFRNKGSRAKTVLVEHPIDGTYKLIEPASATERTATDWRVRVTVPPGERRELKVVTERPLVESLVLLDADVNRLEIYLKQAAATPELKQALTELMTRRRRMTDLQARQKAIAEKIQAITADQMRIRENMARLRAESALYGRYEKTLDQQEDQLIALREELATVQRDLAAATGDLKDWLEKLVVHRPRPAAK